MKHAPCHLDNGIICYSILLRCIWGRSLLLNIMIPQEWLNALETNTLSLSKQNVLILCTDCVYISALNFLNFAKQSPLDFNT